MLHDLYLLSCYFDPPQAVLYEAELERRYGLGAVKDAVEAGYVEIYCPPCSRESLGFFARLSVRGKKYIESMMT